MLTNNLSLTSLAAQAAESAAVCPVQAVKPRRSGRPPPSHSHHRGPPSPTAGARRVLPREPGMTTMALTLPFTRQEKKQKHQTSLRGGPLACCYSATATVLSPSPLSNPAKHPPLPLFTSDPVASGPPATLHGTPAVDEIVHDLKLSGSRLSFDLQGWYPPAAHVGQHPPPPPRRPQVPLTTRNNSPQNS